jgi:hypothetical protein
MTNLEIILIIAIVFLLIAHIFNFISVIVFDGFLADAEDLLCNFFWPIFLPIALVRRFLLGR